MPVLEYDRSVPNLCIAIGKAASSLASYCTIGVKFVATIRPVSGFLLYRRFESGLT